MSDVWVLRLRHRPYRDQRLTTHLCLTARAFGANGIVINGPRDQKLLDVVEDLDSRKGGSFQVSFTDSPKHIIDAFKQRGFRVVHLTMKGEPFEEYTKQPSRSSEPTLVAVGGPKVPPWTYEAADHNLRVGSEPHSEVAALAAFLYSLHGEMPTVTERQATVDLEELLAGRKAA